MTTGEPEIVPVSVSKLNPGGRDEAVKLVAGVAVRMLNSKGDPTEAMTSVGPVRRGKAVTAMVKVFVAE